MGASKLYHKKLNNHGLLGSTAMYTITKLVKASIPFLLLPILTAFLNQEEFGLITMFLTLSAFFLPVVTFNLDTAISRRFYYKNEDIGSYTGNAFFLATLLFIVCQLGVLLFNSFLAKLTLIPGKVILIIPFYCYSQFFILSLLALWQVREKALKYGIYQILVTLADLGLSIMLIVHFKIGWTGRINAIIFTSVLFALIAIVLLVKRDDLKLTFDKSKLAHAFKFGSQLIPHAIGGTLIIMTNRFFLTKMISLEETGLYSVANQIASVISFLTISFNNAYVPWLYKKLSLNSEVEKIKIVKFTYQYFIVLSIIGFIFAISIPFLYRILINPNFNDSIPYVYILIIGYIFQGMYFMVTNYILYVEKNYIIATITIILGLVNIPVNYFLIKSFSSIGATLSFAVIFFIFFLVTWIFSNKLYPMPWSLKLSK